MTKKPRKRTKSDDVERTPHERVTQQLVEQLKPYLPIKSLEQITNELDEIEIDNFRLPVQKFAPHIGDNMFPIESVEDLEQKLSAGIRRTVSLARSGFITPRHQGFIGILSNTFQEPQGQLRARKRVFSRYRFVPATTRQSGKAKTSKGGG